MTTLTKYPTPADAGGEVHMRAERDVSAHGGTYADAMHVVLKADRELATAYAEPAAGVTGRPPVPVPTAMPLAQGKTPGETVHLRTVALMDLVTHLDYQSAVNQVLAADPAFKGRLREELKMSCILPSVTVLSPSLGASRGCCLP